MSRGQGSQQRAVIDMLMAHASSHPAAGDDPMAGTFTSWRSVVEMAGPGSTRSSRESIRRAVLSLAAAGVVQVMYVRKDGHRHLMLSARLQPDAETSAAWDRSWQEVEQQRNLLRRAYGLSG